MHQHTMRTDSSGMSRATRRWIAVAAAASATSALAFIAALLMALLSGCDGGDGPAGTVAGVKITVTDAKAVNGGCGDAAPPVEPDGGYKQCGPDTEFHVTVTLVNEGSGTATVKPMTATMLMVNGDAEVTSGTLTLGHGETFDGTLASGQSVTVTYDTPQTGFLSSGSGYGENVYYKVTFEVDGKSITLSSPPTDFRPLPS